MHKLLRGHVFISLDTCLGVDMLGPTVTTLNLSRNVKWLHLSTFPAAMYEGSNLRSSPTLFIVLVEGCPKLAEGKHYRSSGPAL